MVESEVKERNLYPDPVISIRPANQQDLEKIIILAHKQETDLQKDDPTRVVPTMDELRTLYADRLSNDNKDFKYGIFVAEQNGAMVGYAIAKSPLHRESPYYVLFQGIYVEPMFRMHGIASKLSDQISKFASEMGASSIERFVKVGSGGEQLAKRSGCSFNRIDQTGWARYSSPVRR